MRCGICHDLYARGSSTGGQRFYQCCDQKKVKRLILHWGLIPLVLDVVTIILGSALVFKDVDGLIYGIIVTYLMTYVMDRIMYGIDEENDTYRDGAWR